MNFGKKLVTVGLVFLLIMFGFWAYFSGAKEAIYLIGYLLIPGIPITYIVFRKRTSDIKTLAPVEIKSKLDKDFGFFIKILIGILVFFGLLVFFFLFIGGGLA